MGRSHVLRKPEELMTYECDGCVLVKHPPQLVVNPANTQQVADVVSVCLDFNVPYVARGAGTGLSGGALPSQGGVIIGLARLNHILSIDVENRVARCEAGVVNAWLNKACEPYGLFYAPDPSSQAACTIGGNVAENAGGIHCFKYGVTVDHCLGATMVTTEGRVVKLAGPSGFGATGLDWMGLMVGSEGTFGIVTEIDVRLTPIPADIVTYLVAFSKVAQATETVEAIISSGLVPAALEFMDAFTVKAVNEAFDVGFPAKAKAVLLIELDGTAEQVAHDDKRLKALMKPFKPLQIQSGRDSEERQRLWKARKGAVAAYGRYQPAFYLHDCVIPRQKLTEVLEAINAIGKEYDVLIGNVFHAGDGNLHPNMLLDPNDADMVSRVMAAGKAMLQVCLDAGGVLSGEHGIGLEKSEFMALQYSEESLAVMQRLKWVFDPVGLANPLKIFPTRSHCGETNAGITLPEKHVAIGQGAWI